MPALEGVTGDAFHHNFRSNLRPNGMWMDPPVVRPPRSPQSPGSPGSPGLAASSSSAAASPGGGSSPVAAARARSRAASGQSGGSMELSAMLNDRVLDMREVKSLKLSLSLSLEGTLPSLKEELRGSDPLLEQARALAEQIVQANGAHQQAQTQPLLLRSMSSSGALSKARSADGTLRPPMLSPHQEAILNYHSLGAGSTAEELCTNFRRKLLRKYRSAAAAWRALDPAGNGRASFADMSRAAKSLGYLCNPRSLWEAFDADKKGFVHLEDLDPRLGRLLRAFAGAACQASGSAEAAWREHFSSPSAAHARCTWLEFARAAEALRFGGDVQRVFAALSGHTPAPKADPDTSLQGFQQVAAALGFRGDARLVHAALGGPRAAHPEAVHAAAAAGRCGEAAGGKEQADLRGGVKKEDFLMLDRWFRPVPVGVWRYRGVGMEPASPAGASFTSNSASAGASLG